MSVPASCFIPAAGYVFDLEGRRTGTGARVIVFSGRPLQLYVSPSFPYIVSLQSGCVEVHNSRTAGERSLISADWARVPLRLLLLLRRRLTWLSRCSCGDNALAGVPHCSSAVRATAIHCAGGRSGLRLLPGRVPDATVARIHRHVAP